MNFCFIWNELILNLKLKPKYFEHFNTLVDKYSQSLKTLKVSFDYLKEEELKSCVDCICTLKNLKSLELSIDSVHNSHKPIDESIALIGQKCTKILKFDLIIKESVPISNRFFDIFTHFKSLTKLKIVLRHKTVMNGSVESFKHCKQLIDLSLKFSELSEDFFIDIESFVPKLQLLDISSKKWFSESMANSFTKMNNLQNVYIAYDSEEAENIMVWYFGKHLYEVMSRSEQSHVIRINDNCGLISLYRDLVDFS